MKRLQGQDGNAVVLVLLSIIALLGMFAIGLEAGWIYSTRAQAQNAADAAAHAAVLELQECDADAAARADAIAAAREAMTANLVAGRALELGDDDIVFGRYYPYSDGSEKNFVVTNDNPNSVQVAVHMDGVRNGPLDLTIGKLLGRATANVAAGAIATRDRRVIGFDTDGGAGRLIPFGAHADSIGPIGSEVFFFEGSQQTGSGNWGLIDLHPDGTGFTTDVNNGADTIADQIANGYQGEVVLDPALGTVTGGRTGQASGPIAQGFEGRIGEVVVIAVYDGTPAASGTNLIYHVVDFVTVRIDDVITTGAISDRGIRATVVNAVDATAKTDPDAEENCLISKVQITG